MNSRARRILLLVLAAALLAGAGRVQQSLNRDRDTLGLTQTAALQNAPPLLAFTTVALGGFRGLISNYLWIRSNDLQLDDKYFEAAQLADWITDLEPRFATVWVFEAWNMAFNISVKFKDFSDRWNWLQRGIELLRDRALLYNPDSVPIYQQLAWFYQFKMGGYLDDAQVYYKGKWALEMMPFFGPKGTNFTALVNPQTAQEKAKAAEFKEKYKIDPVFAEKVNSEWGPLDWRLPEAHAIYWASEGLEKAKEDPDKVKPGDLIQLRRVVYQSMLQAFHHGRFITDPFTNRYTLGPNLDLVAKVNDAYLTMMKEDPPSSNEIAVAHRNFLRDAVYFLYDNNRVAEAAKWYRDLGQRYPDKPILDKVPDSLPKNLTLDQYAADRVQEDIGDFSEERTTSDIRGLLATAYYNLAIGEDDHYQGLRKEAEALYQSYQKRLQDFDTSKRIVLAPFQTINRAVLDQILDPKNGALLGFNMPMRAVIRTQLKMQREPSIPPSISTNAPPESGTNAVENAPTNSAAP